MRVETTLKILVVEDDPYQGEILGRWLSRMHDPVLVPVLAHSLAAALGVLSERCVDAVVLDRLLGDGDGLTLLGVIRRHKRLRNLPVLLVSGLIASREVVVGLTRGADDYLSKPLSLEVFSARLLAVLRRCRPEATTVELLQGPGFRLDAADGRLLIDGRVEHLEPKEAALLAALLRRQNVILSADALRESAWGGAEQARNTLETRLYTLRRKLGARSACLETIRGKGYRLLS
jgi:two-component system alkaline phosphatase synthesis response regulator PhoP